MTLMNLNTYIDTSVISALDDPRVPQFQEISRKFGKLLGHGIDGYISQVVIAEIKAAPAHRVRQMEIWIQQKKLVVLGDDPIITALGHAYINEGILPQNSLADAFHLAFATFYEMDYLVSWNFSHLVNETRKQAFWNYNFKQALHLPKIITPGSLTST